MLTKEQEDRLIDLGNFVAMAQTNLLPGRPEDLMGEVSQLPALMRNKVEQYFGRNHPDTYMKDATSKGYSGYMALIYAISFMKTDLAQLGSETVPVVEALGRSATAILALDKAKKQVLSDSETGANVSVADVFNRLPFDGQIINHVARKALWTACNNEGKQAISNSLYVRYFDEVDACRTNQDMWLLKRKINGEMFMSNDSKVKLFTDLCERARKDEDGYTKDRDGLVTMLGGIDDTKGYKNRLTILGFMEDMGDFDNKNVAAIYDFREELRAKYVESSERGETMEKI